MGLTYEDERYVRVYTRDTTGGKQTMSMTYDEYLMSWMREVRRLRGEVGRAMFKEDLDKEIFAPLFARPEGDNRRVGE